MLDFLLTDPRVLTACLLGTVAAVGLASLLRRRVVIGRGAGLAHEFLNRLHDYVKSSGKDDNAYVWLTKNSNSVQNLVGVQGYMDFQPPFQNYLIKNMPVILNCLPLLRQEFETFTFSDGRRANEYTRFLQETVLRYLGVADEEQKALRTQLLNPVIWLREGTQQALSIPVRALQWVGLISAITVSRAIHSELFRIVAGIVALIGFAASVMTLVLGWPEFKEILAPLLEQ